jgi:hypothetical protein
MVRDKLLVLSGVVAVEMGLPQIAAVCRRQVLAHNPWHLVRRWPTLAEAMDDDAFQDYLRQLSRRYSPEKAEHLLVTLGIEMGRERQAYFTDHEYAVALLGVTADELEQAVAEVATPRALMVHRKAPAGGGAPSTVLRRQELRPWWRGVPLPVRFPPWLLVALVPMALGLVAVALAGLLVVALAQ